MAYINRLTDINQNLILLNEKEDIANLSLSNIDNTLSGTLNVQVQNTSIPVTSASNLNVNVTNTSIPITSASNLNVQVQNASIPITSASNLNVQVQNTSLNTVTTFGSNLSDLFGNLKVSNSHTLLDITHVYDTNILMMDQYNNGGTVSGPNYNASILMGVTASGNQVIRQSRLYTQYQPGKSLCIRLTGVINANSNGLNTISRIGYFDNLNGLFFEYSKNATSNGMDMKIVKRKQSGSSTYDDLVIPQGSWNIDKLNGTGTSGINIDFSKNLIYYIEFAYLGVGIVKFGVIYSGTLYIAHILYHTDLTYPYIVSPNLPVRWEISSSGASGLSGQLICTCASVQSEGGYNLQGNPFSAGTAFNDTGISVAKQTATYLMSIRLKTNQRRICRLQSVSLFCSTSADVIFEIYKCLSPSVTPFNSAPSYTSANTNSSIEYHVNTDGKTFDPTTATSNAILIYKGSFSSNTNIDYTNFSNMGGPIYVTSGITNNSDYIIVRVYTLITNLTEKFQVSMNWIEV